MRVSLNWLKDYIRVKGSPQSLAELLTMAGLNVERSGKVLDDTIFEIEITTNRPDWLSHLGVAREIHAVTGARFEPPASQYKKAGRAEKTFKVSIPDPDLCPYYSAILLEDVEWNPTPDFIAKRLITCGMHTINLIVDITNYVLLEYGQPLHAFDADLLRGEEISARRAKLSEKITAIDGMVYELKQDDLIIADAKGPIAIGGVMGGKDLEINQETRNVLLESAFFNPVAIRRTSRRLGLISESSYRFERKVDPKGVHLARERAVHLISKYAGFKKISPVFCTGRLPIRRSKISLDLAYVKKILGFGISVSQAKTYLKRLGLDVSGTNKTIRAEVPSFRADLTKPIDLIEELARLYGYNKIPEAFPLMAPLEPRVEPILVLQNEIRNLSVSFGFHEAVCFSLVESAFYDQLSLFKGERVRLINPQNKELNLMRPSLLTGLLQAVKGNLSVGETDIRLFEIGNRYLEESKRKLPKEERMVAFALSGEGRLNWLEKKRPASFYDLKGIAEEFFARLGVEAIEVLNCGTIYQAGEGIQVSVKGKNVGSYGALSEHIRNLFGIDRPVFYGEFSIEAILPFAQKNYVLKDIPKFPVSPRDLTLIIDEQIKAQVVVDYIRSMAKDLAEKIQVFDQFRGGQIPKGKKSLSFRIFYQSKGRTLQNEEVNQLHFSIVDSLKESLGAELPKSKSN